MKKMQLIGEILTRAGATGDAELTRLLGELMTEVSTQEQAAVQAASKYVVCVEATTPDGVKVQHPVVGGGCIPQNISDIKMAVSDNLVGLQRETQAMAAAIERMYGVHVRYVPVTDKALASLEEKLANLLENLSTAIDEAAEKKAEAYGVMGIELQPEDISNDMIADILQKTLYAGACLTEDGQVADRTSEKYREEEEIERRNSRSDDEDGYEEEDSECDEEDEDGEEDDGDYDED